MHLAVNRLAQRQDGTYQRKEIEGWGYVRVSQQVIDGAQTSEQESLTIQLLRTRESLMQHFRPMLGARDVSETQWRVLRSLYERGEMEAQDLAHVSAVMAPSLTRMLKVLEERGLLETTRHPKDGRRVVISLSAKGRTFMEEAIPEMQRIYAELSSVIGTERMQRLQQLLREVADMAGQLSEE